MYKYRDFLLSVSSNYIHPTSASKLTEANHTTPVAPKTRSLFTFYQYLKERIEKLSRNKSKFSTSISEELESQTNFVRAWSVRYIIVAIGTTKLVTGCSFYLVKRLNAIYRLVCIKTPRLWNYFYLLWLVASSCIGIIKYETCT